MVSRMKKLFLFLSLFVIGCSPHPSESNQPSILVVEEATTLENGGCRYEVKDVGYSKYGTVYVNGMYVVGPKRIWAVGDTLYNFTKPK